MRVRVDVPVTPPEGAVVADTACVETLERWADAQRDELVALHARLIDLLADAERAESLLGESLPVCPASVLESVDAMLDATVAQFDHAVSVAFVTATAQVAGAVAEADELLVVLGGLSQRAVLAGDDSVFELRSLRRPRSASDLWRELVLNEVHRDIAAANPVDPMPGNRPGPSCGVDLFGSGVADEEPSHVYEIFWRRTNAGRATRARLLPHKKEESCD